MLNGTFDDGIHLTCTANGGTSTVDYILASIYCQSYIYICDHFHTFHSNGFIEQHVLERKRYYVIGLTAFTTT